MIKTRNVTLEKNARPSKEIIGPQNVIYIVEY
jgi:hypothetical protein